jgi:putative peptidoglycan lipid II flippase
LAIFCVSTLAALLTFFIRRPLVGLLLGGGAFDEAAVARTALVLGVFCLSIPTESLSHLFARAFYAVQNTIIPVVFSMLSLLVAASSAYVLSSRVGIVGLPLGFFLGSLVKTAGLGALFWRRAKI